MADGVGEHDAGPSPSGNPGPYLLAALEELLAGESVDGVVLRRRRVDVLAVLGDRDALGAPGCHAGVARRVGGAHAAELGEGAGRRVAGERGHRVALAGRGVEGQPILADRDLLHLVEATDVRRRADAGGVAVLPVLADAAGGAVGLGELAGLLVPREDRDGIAGG